MKKRISDLLLIALLLLALWMWKCPLETFFGIPCPGCMMTTAFYYLIQLDVEVAFYFNPAVFLLIFMAVPLAVSYKKNRRLLKYLTVITLIVWIGIYGYRMMTIFPEFPMPYVEDNVFAHLMNLIK